MAGLLFAFMLLQGTSVATGVASGVVLSSSGTPAAGVRVYALPAGDPIASANNATVFESLAQTDASGHFRLEVPAGRYYIAAGSVSSPTYYPNETSISSAKVVTVAAGTIVEGVNFSRYVPASNSPFSSLGTAVQVLPPGSTGVLSGVIRYPDGTAASGITVVALPVSVAANPSAAAATSSFVFVNSLVTSSTAAPSSIITTLRFVGGGIRTASDSAGRYRIENVSPDTYYIAAGYYDFPSFYPGTADVTMATAITTTPTTMLDTLHFTVPAVTGTTIRVHVTTTAGNPVGGAMLSLVGTGSAPSSLAAFLPRRSFKSPASDGDGDAKFLDVPPGHYSIAASISGAPTVSQRFDVNDQPESLDFKLTINVLTGRILMEDGGPISEPLLNEVAVSTVSNPNMIATTILPVSNGAFSAVVNPGDYRFFIRNLPDGYQVRSMTSGTMDLTKETLKISGDDLLNIEVRIGKRVNDGGKVAGRIIDAVTGTPPAADRVQLCCLASGPVERLSTALRADGSFEFSGVPTGRYAVELKGKTSFGIVDSEFDIGNEGKTGLTLLSAPQFFVVSADLAVEGSVAMPPGVMLTVTFTPLSGQMFQVKRSGMIGGTLWAQIPAGIPYNVTVSNIPPGFKVKSVADVAPPPNSPPGYAGELRLTGGSTNIVIKLTAGE